MRPQELDAALAKHVNGFPAGSTIDLTPADAALVTELPTATTEEMQLAIRLCNSGGILVLGVTAELAVTDLLVFKRAALVKLKAATAAFADLKQTAEETQTALSASRKRNVELLGRIAELEK